jgi:heat shock protein HslJ
MNVRRCLALLAIVVSVAACSASAAADETADGSGGELQATTWILRSYNTAGALTLVPDDQFADAEFMSQRVRGFAGCNDFDAVYRTGGRMLLVGPSATTLMSCGEAADAFQTSYLTLLQQSRFYSVRSNSLTIRGADLAVLLVFDAAPANPLLGSWIVDSYASAPNSQSAPLAGTELTAVFRLNKVAGSSGCNTYQGPYTTNGSVAAIGPLASTRMACPDDVMAQETAFLAALQGVGRVVNRGDRLSLTDISGRLLVSLVRPSALEPSPGPSGSAAPTASAVATPTASPTASPTAKPTPSPTATAAPTPTATAAATAGPSAAPSGSPAPTVVPPASIPPTATCALTVPPGTVNATIVYPANWFTVTAPPTVACRYFDPAQITVPADPATLTAAVMIQADPATSYQNALTTATNPTAWNVLTNQAVTVSGLPATRIQATSTAGSTGFPVGVTRYGYLLNVGGRGVWIETSGTVGSAAYTTNMSVVDLMASKSTFTVPA